MNEVWKDIKGFEGMYKISNFGNVKSTKRRGSKGGIVKPCIMTCGYLRLYLHKGNIRKHKLLHRLIADAFIPNPQNKPFVDHINTIRTDNRIENLRWSTCDENNNNPLSKIKASAHNAKTLKGMLGVLHPKSKSVYQFDLNGNLIRKYGSGLEAERCCQIFASNISAVCRGKQKTAGGYKWFYHSALLDELLTILEKEEQQ
jgi:hypothetical protein